MLRLRCSRKHPTAWTAEVQKESGEEGLRRLPTLFPLSLLKGIMLPKVMAFQVRGEGPLQRTGPLKASISLQVSEWTS